MEEFTASYEQPADNRERADLTVLPAQLRLEVQYALQCRCDDNMIRTKATTVRSMVRWLAASRAASLLDRGEQDWRAACPPHAARSGHPVALLIYAHRKITALAEGEGWDNEYPRDTWHMRRLGIDSPCATLQFAGIPQPWLKDLAKRWTRWRLSTGISAQTCYRGVRALTRLAKFLAAAGVTRTSEISRDVLERYLADLAAAKAGRREHRDHVGQAGTFLRDIRRHQWDTSLPASAVIFPEDYPREGRRLPRALAGHIMTQVENPANLAQQDNPAYRLITLILIRCGLRITDATAIPADCTVRDADGAPYLRYYNRKMKREALVPIDDELETLISQQRERNRERWPQGTPVLFPRPKANIGGTRPIDSSTYRDGLYRWLEDCDVRDEHGRPVHLKPHQWRHTLGTVLKVSRVASAASFGSSREHALPAAQRAALQRARRAGAPGGCGDQGFHGPPGSDATMMRLRPLRGVHHRCVFWHHDAFGSSRLHRVHHRRCRSAAPGRHRSREGRAEPSRHWSRHPPDLAPAALVAPGASRVPGPEVPAAASSPVSSAARRRAADAAGAHRTPRPVKAPDLALVHGWGIHTRNHRPGSSLQAPGSG